MSSFKTHCVIYSYEFYNMLHSIYNGVDHTCKNCLLTLAKHLRFVVARRPHSSNISLLTIYGKTVVIDACLNAEMAEGVFRWTFLLDIQ